MKSTAEIINLIKLLDDQIADDLEGQDLDFKQWNDQSQEENVKKMIRYAVCMANGGGGSVVFGIADRVSGMENVLRGVPFNIDTTELEKSVYENTMPHIEVFFEDIFYNNHSIRILVMHAYPGRTIYTTIDGTTVIRKGKECHSCRTEEA